MRLASFLRSYPRLTSWARLSRRVATVGSWSRICGGLVRFARELADDGHLLLAVRTAILMKDFVKPHRRIAEDVGTLPRVPRQVGLRLARDKSPVDGRDAVLLRDRQD